MNYLAHTLLTIDDDEILFGNLIADTISNAERDQLNHKMQLGVLLHRFIDSYTDKHPAVRNCTAVLRKNHGKYAPVVFDLCSDYLLVNSWESYHSQSMPTVVEKAYQALSDHLPTLSQKRQDKFAKMIEHDFLRNSITLERLGKTLVWMDKRTKFPSNFNAATQDLEDNLPYFKGQFDVFFPALIHDLEQYKKAELSKN